MSRCRSIWKEIESDKIAKEVAADVRNILKSTMTEDKTITDNEVIAIFDGREDGYDEHGVWQKLKYESDWRDLMPVWYKFRDLKFSSIADTSAWLDHCGVISIAILDKGPSPSEACKLLADGIRWYNSIQKA